VVGYSFLLRPILRQLTRNAVEAMERQEQRRITVKTCLEADEHLAAIYFGDNGPGVPDHLRRQIFTQPVEHPDKEGGRGLMLTRQMINDMGGSIRLLPDQPNQGAVFLIKLPAHTTPPEGAATITTGDNEQEDMNALT